MEKRNDWLEDGGLILEDDKFEWFLDKTSTQYARMKDSFDVALSKVSCYVVRDKKTGDYNRVVVDEESNQAVHETDSLESIGFFIDKLKIIERFNKEE